VARREGRLRAREGKRRGRGGCAGGRRRGAAAASAWRRGRGGRQRRGLRLPCAVGYVCISVSAYVADSLCRSGFPVPIRVSFTQCLAAPSVHIQFYSPCNVISYGDRFGRRMFPFSTSSSPYYLLSLNWRKINTIYSSVDFAKDLPKSSPLPAAPFSTSPLSPHPIRA
jgi:hypothetical protein